MRLFLIFIYSFITIITQTWTSEQEPKLRLVVSPAGYLFGAGPPVLVRKVDESLNLTCRLQNQNQETLQNYNISWNWQYSMGSNANRVMVVSLSHNEANLVFVSLKETDSGEYTCKCAELDLSENVRVKVKAYKKYCSEKTFVCAPGQCIGKHYVCDGKKDCKDGIDESFIHCGPHPCEGKIPCEDGRCIPTSWCCDEMHDPNCTVKNKPKCCQQLLKPYQDQDPIFSEQHFSDMGFLQTTIYTVIGCAMAFMFIVTILVIAICRVHIKRTIVSRCPLNHQHLRPGSPLRPTLPLYDIDMFLDRHTDSTSHPGLLVTYNINNGVQFVGRPVDPPPYCEVIDTPPREGPPPPYVSRENVNISSENSQENFDGVSQDSAIHESDGDSVDVIRLVSYVPAPVGITANDNSIVEQCDTSDCPNDREIEVNASKVIDNNIQQNVAEEICSSPSVSGLNTKNIENKTKRHIFNDFSDSESDSMESDALLSEATIERKDSVNKSDEDDSKVTRSSSLNANISSTPPHSFLNNITAVSKTLIGSLKRQTDSENRSKINKQLITQKSFDSSDPCDLKVANSEHANYNNKVTHSVGDLSPVNADFERLDFLTLPLRESFIGVRNEEV